LYIFDDLYVCINGEYFLYICMKKAFFMNSLIYIISE